MNNRIEYSSPQNFNLPSYPSSHTDSPHQEEIE
jgi:hypothetical protein